MGYRNVVKVAWHSEELGSVSWRIQDRRVPTAIMNAQPGGRKATAMWQDDIRDDGRKVPGDCDEWIAIVLEARASAEAPLDKNEVELKRLIGVRLNDSVREWN